MDNIRIWWDIPLGMIDKLDICVFFENLDNAAIDLIDVLDKKWEKRKTRDPT